MPECGCFHTYELSRQSSDAFSLTVYTEGYVCLKEVVEAAGLAQVVTEDTWWFDGERFDLKGVKHEAQLRYFLGLLRHRIFIDLRPTIDESYALGPYTVFEGAQAIRTRLGSLIYQAKYSWDRSASQALCGELKTFIAGHPRLANIGAIIAAPKSDPRTPDLAGQWAQDIARSRGWYLVEAVKVRDTKPQKALDVEVSEEEAAARAANSVQVRNIRPGTQVLVIDDTIRSGGTMKETARACQAAGGGIAFGLSVGKDARFRRGIDLDKKAWP